MLRNRANFHKIHNRFGQAVFVHRRCITFYFCIASPLTWSRAVRQASSKLKVSCANVNKQLQTAFSAEAFPSDDNRSPGVEKHKDQIQYRCMLLLLCKGWCASLESVRLRDAKMVKAQALEFQFHSTCAMWRISLRSHDCRQLSSEQWLLSNILLPCCLYIHDKHLSSSPGLLPQQAPAMIIIRFSFIHSWSSRGMQASSFLPLFFFFFFFRRPQPLWWAFWSMLQVWVCGVWWWYSDGCGMQGP